MTFFQQAISIRNRWLSYRLRYGWYPWI